MSSIMVPIYFVDAFTTNGNSAFTGNPAAVCFLDYDDEIPDDVKQKIASEINLSETAFISFGWQKGEKLASAEGSQLHRRTIRWFTPTTEVDLCGHATVASTKALVEAQFTDLYLDPSVKTITISFESKFKGKLPAAYSKDSGKITLNFPSNPPHPINKADKWIDKMVKAVLGDKVSSELITDLRIAPEAKVLMIRLEPQFGQENSVLLRKVNPDMKEIRGIDTGDVVRDIVVTVKGEGDPTNAGNKAPHFYSRFFSPLDGIDEDPATGFAHTVLTPYWTEELTKSLNDSGTIGTLLGHQLSKRGGNIYCTLVGDRVTLSGEAKVMIKGHLVI